MSMELSICLNCGHKYVKTKKTRKYCSERCGSAFLSRRSRIRNRTKVIGSSLKIDSLNGEVWMPIIGYERKYEVSSFGRVKSLSYKQTGTENILKKHRNKFGYEFVSLNYNGQNKTIGVHRLVALSFIPNTYNKPSVNHIDNNRSNNNVKNLEWCTARENTQHAIRCNRFNINFTDETRKLGSVACMKKVIDISTGYIYNSITEAALKNHFKIATLSAKLLGKNRNETSLRFLNNYNWQAAEEKVYHNPIILLKK